MKNKKDLLKQKLLVGAFIFVLIIGLFFSFKTLAKVNYFQENVGIGTTDVGNYRLKVYGDVGISGNLNAGSIGIGTASGANINCGTNLVLGEPVISGGVVTSGTCQDITAVGGVTGTGTPNYIPKWGTTTGLVDSNIIYESGGNVGIGSTSPAAKLDINGNIQAPMYYDRDNPTYYFDPAGNVGSYSLYAAKGAVFETGNVGIGTTNPSRKLEIYDSSANTVGIQFNNGTYTSNLFFNRIDGQWFNGALANDFGVRTDDGRFVVAMDNAAKFLIDTSGNVGIGVTTPSSFKLQIAGNAGPNANASYDLGSSALKWKDGYFSGTLTAGTLSGNLGGTVTIGAGNVSSGAFGSGTGGGNYSFPANVAIGTTAQTTRFYVTNALNDTGNVSYIENSATLSSSYNTKTLYVVGASSATVGNSPISTAIYALGGNIASDGTSPGARSYALYVDAGAITYGGVGKTYAIYVNDGDSYLGSGNVGIGTTDPGSYKLNVQGPTYISTDLTVDGGDVTNGNVNVDIGEAYTTGLLLSESTDNSYFDIYCADSGGNDLCEFKSGIYNNGGTFYSQNQIYARAGIANDTTSTKLSLNDADGIQLGGDLFNAGGYKLIQGSNVSDWLRIYGDSFTNGIAAYKGISTDGGFYAGSWTQAGAGNVKGTGVVYFSGSGNNYFAGNVGIGTTNPQTALHVHGSSAWVTLGSSGTDYAGILFKENTSTTRWSIFKGNLADPGFYIGRYDSSGTWQGAPFSIDTNGNVSMAHNLTVTGKINTSEIDPVYEINDVKYATYGHFTTGLKEETTGKVKLGNQVIRKSGNREERVYTAIIEFNKAEVGSDLWLFKQITAFGKNWQDLVVSLTPEGRAEVWYELNEKENTLTIFGNQPVKVSYRLIAPRFDWPERNTNLATDQEAQSIKVK